MKEYVIMFNFHFIKLTILTFFAFSLVTAQDDFSDESQVDPVQKISISGKVLDLKTGKPGPKKITWSG